MVVDREGARGTSIRSRLLLVLLLVLIPLTILQAGLHYRDFRIKRVEATESNLEIARATAAVIGTYVDDIVAQETAAGVALSQLPALPHAQAQAYLRAAARPYPPIVSLSWVSPEGQVLVSTQPRLEGTRVTGTDWFRRLRAGGHWTLTNMHRGRSAAEDTFTLATAVRERPGRIAGLVEAEVRASQMEPWLRVPRGPGAAINVVDASGWLVSRYPAEPMPPSLRNWGQRYPPVAAALKGKESAARIHAPAEHVDRFLAEVPISSLGWAAGASRTEASVLAESRRVLLWDLVALIMVSVSALAAALLAGREITQPIERLREHARQIAEGRPAAALPPAGPTEVAELTGSLNRMAEAVQAREAERERASQEREEQARLLDTVVENTRAHLAYLDREFTFLQVNATYAEGSGHAKAELIGRNHFDLFPNEENERIFAQVRDTGRPMQFIAKPFEFADQPGRGITYWDWTLVPVENGRGAVEGLVLSLVDVTEQIRQRERLLAAERERAEIAEHLNDEIAHRVKNNLAMISGLLQMQSLRQDDPRLTEALRDAMARVRTFASIHELMYAGQADRIDLLEAVRRVAEMNREMSANGRSLRITTSGASVPCASRTATNVCVLMNELITNARKHGAPAAEGELQIEVHLEVERSMLALEVWNSGGYAPPAPGQARPSGMGLMLVRAVVEDEYRGAFSLGSARGGTLARATFPFAACQADAR